MNKYRSAMEKLTVTPQMEERILTNLSSKKETRNKIPQKPYLKWIRYAGTCAACAAILCIMLLNPSIINLNWGNQQIQTPQLTDNSEGSVAQPGGLQAQAPGASDNSGGSGTKVGGNPIVNIKGVDELKKAVRFELLVPEKPPSGYKIDHISVISGKLAQIIYSDGSNKITYRTAKGTDDISGDYTSYEESDVVEIGDTEVTLKGSKSLINLAIWIKDDCSYSLSFSTGVEKEAVVSIIESMKKA